MTMRILILVTMMLGLVGCVTPITHESSLIHEPARKDDAVILFSAFGAEGEEEPIKGSVSVILSAGNPNEYRVNYGEFRLARVLPNTEIIGIKINAGALGFGESTSWPIKPIRVAAGTITYLGDYGIKRKPSGELTIAIKNKKQDVFSKMNVMYAGIKQQLRVQEKYPAMSTNIASNIGGKQNLPAPPPAVTNNPGVAAIASASGPNLGSVPKPNPGNTVYVFYQQNAKLPDCTIKFDDEPNAKVLSNGRLIYFETTGPEAAFDVECGMATSRNYFRSEVNKSMAFALDVVGSTIDLKRQ